VLIGEALDNVCRQLGSRVCPIFRLDKYFSRPRLIGSAVPYGTADYGYLITASHVLDAVAGEQTITLGVNEFIRFPTAASQIKHIRGSTVDADVAVIRLPEPVRTEMESRFDFVGKTEVGEVAPYDKLILYSLVGYPVSKNKDVSRNMTTREVKSFHYTLREFFDVSLLASSGKNEPIHFGLKAQRSAFGRGAALVAKSVPQFKPHGMSGGGIWRIQFDRETGASVRRCLSA